MKTQSAWHVRTAKTDQPAPSEPGKPAAISPKSGQKRSALAANFPLVAHPLQECSAACLLSGMEAPAQLALGPRYDASAMLQELVAVCNQQRGELDQSFLYVDGTSANDWLRLCNSAAYVSGIRQQAPLETIGWACAQLTGNLPLCINGLGPGDGKAETRFTIAVAENRTTSAAMTLNLLDISHTLLCEANQYAAQQLQGRAKVYALHASFHDLGRARILHEDKGPLRARRIYTMLGATMANLRNEVDFFAELGRWAHSDDLLVLDFQLTYAPASDPVAVYASDPPLIHGPSPTHRDWLTGPLRRHCVGVDAIDLRMELNTHCPVPGSYELQCLAKVQMRTGEIRDFLVWRGKRYEPHQLGECLRGKGWEPMKRIEYGAADKPSAAVMVLRRS